jgi:ribosomal-protein-serine acetyltransferase
MQLACAHRDLVLVSLAAADAEELHALLQANRAYLMRWSDYSREIDTTVQEWRETLSASGDLDFGLRVDGGLVGRACLLGQAPRYGLGYWVAETFTGRGLATAAVGALVSHARDGLGATDILAGVSHGNAPSVAVLKRNGFTSVADFGTYERFHLPLTSEGLSASMAAAL